MSIRLEKRRNHVWRRLIAVVVIFFVALLSALWSIYHNQRSVYAINATFVVTSTADSGPGSLRDAIIQSNATPTLSSNQNLITFSITGQGVHTIDLLTTLPQITQPTIIDGTTQSGATCGELVPATLPATTNTPHTLMIEISAQSIAGPVTTLDFTNTASGSGVKGLVIYGAKSGYNVYATATDMSASCNYIGTKADGVTDVDHDGSGGMEFYFAHNALIENNLVSGNGPQGVVVLGSNNVTLRNNLIGGDQTGKAILPNQNTIADTGSGLVIGSNINIAIYHNLIVGHPGNGIDTSGSMVNGVIRDNYIGVDITASTPLPNKNGIARLTADGLLIGGASDADRNFIVVKANGTGMGVGGKNATVSHNTVGISLDKKTSFGGSGVMGIELGFSSADGVNVIEENVIGNVANGIFDESSSPCGQSLRIRANLVGVAPSGELLGVTTNGIHIRACDNTEIGGGDANDRNVIGGVSGGTGIRIEGATGTVVKGNYIGTAPDGVTPRPNGTGIVVGYGATTTTIGGVMVSERNIIAGNSDEGITILYYDTANGSRIVGNYIGLNKDGHALANGGYALKLDRGGWTIGGNNAGEGNRIGLNGRWISWDASDGYPRTVYGNSFGFEADGETATANTLDTPMGISGSSPLQFGGPNSGEANQIGNVNGTALAFQNSGPNTYRIQGNIFGSSVSGRDAPITWAAIGTWSTSLGPVLIGGDTPAEGNTITVFGDYGIDFSGSVSNSTIKYNTIERARQDYTSQVAGGIFLSGTSAHNSITRNSIHDNVGSGIVVANGTANIGNTIRQNSIYNNGGSSGIGIDLGNDGVTHNDIKDSDMSANNMQNYPILSASMTSCDNTVETRPIPVFNSAPNTTFIIDYYSNPSWNSGSGALRQGEHWVGSEIVITDANGSAPLDTVLINGITNPSATATAPDGSTSEFGSLSNMVFSQCQDMLQRQLTTTTQDFFLQANFTAINIPATYLRNQPRWPDDYNQTTGEWADHLETVGLTFKVTVGGQEVIPVVPTIWNSAYSVSNGSWNVTGRTASALPEGEYDVVLTLTDPLTGLSMTKTYPRALKVVQPKISYTTTFTNNATPTLHATGSGIMQINYAYVLPQGSPVPDSTLGPSDPGYQPSRVVVWTADKDAQGNQLDTGSLRVITGKTEYIAYLTQYFAIETKNDQANFENNFALLYLSDILGESTAAGITTLIELKATCSNAGVQQRIIDWWGASIAGESDCQDWLQTQYDQIATSLEQQLQGQITVVNNGTSGYDFTPLPQGVYDIYFLDIVDLDSNRVARSFPKGLVVDFTTPTATLHTTSATDIVSPQLNGSVSDPAATVKIELIGPEGRHYGPYTAVNNGDGTWTLLAGSIQPGLLPGNYNVILTVTSLAGNTSTENKVLIVSVTSKGELAATGQDMRGILSGIIITFLSTVVVLRRGFRRYKRAMIYYR